MDRNQLSIPGAAREASLPAGLPDTGNVQLPAERTSDEVPSGSHSLVHGVNAFTKIRAIGAGKPGLGGGLFSVAAGAYDLVFNDFTQFKTTLNSGDSSRMFSSGLQLAADGLLIGGGLASMSSRFAVPGAVASLAGSGIKLVSDGIGYSKGLK